LIHKFGKKTLLPCLLLPLALVLPLETAHACERRLR
jgi:hypothetical protein